MPKVVKSLQSANWKRWVWSWTPPTWRTSSMGLLQMLLLCCFMEATLLPLKEWRRETVSKQRFVRNLKTDRWKVWHLCENEPVVFTGMFFHWVSCAAIWVISVIGNVLLQTPRFYPFVMLGGVIWATGTVSSPASDDAGSVHSELLGLKFVPQWKCADECLSLWLWSSGDDLKF